MTPEAEAIRDALLEGGRCHAKHYGTFDFSPAHHALEELEALRAAAEAERDKALQLSNDYREGFETWWKRAERAEAVVAAQREALRAFFAEFDAPGGEYAPTDATEALMRAALDAEEVSEPSGSGEGCPERDEPGSLTSPVDTAPGAKP